MEPTLKRIFFTLFSLSRNWKKSWLMEQPRCRTDHRAGSFCKKIMVKIDFQKIELNLLVPRPCQYLPFFTSFYTRREGQEPGPLQTVEVYPY